jgi:transcriptional regulator GlxA family with amidase domain
MASPTQPQPVTGNPPSQVSSGRHSIWFVIYPGLQSLDLTGPFEVFEAANRVLDALGMDGARYALRVVGETPSVHTESGLRLACDPLPSEGAPDTLVIPGGDGVDDAASSASLLVWLRQIGNDCPRLATVCTGTFLAAAVGLIDGHAVTTHWASAGRLARTYPDLDVDPEAIYRRDGRVWTSAGVTAGIDLALAMVEHDHGAAVAQHVARYLVVFLRRPGGQSQFSAPVWVEPAESEPVRAAQDLIHSNPAADLRLEALAGAAGISPRHLTRLFTDALGETPGKYVERVRLTAARHQLETTTSGLEAVARHCGFGTAETLRRVFVRQLGVSPDRYRKSNQLKSA